jgi:L-lysine exporter family protein LysE/ArgO
MIVAFFLGLVCAFVGSIPIAGPTGVLIVERALHRREREAMVAGAGAAIAEAGYALLAFMGMTAALSRFPWLIPASRVVGSLILIGLGLYFALRAPPAAQPHADKEPKGRGAFFVGLVVTGINPTLLASWSAVVTILHGTGALRVEPLDALPFAAGVGLGTASWFIVLVELLTRFRERVGDQTLARLVRTIGWFLVAGGLALLTTVVVRALNP